jgi:N-acyl-D-amino-acid deacylase
MFDLAICDGTVVDGTGSPGFRADVAITADRVARIGKIDPTAARTTINAAGCVVSPGFIDVHNHSEGWLLKLPQFVPKLSQGFTTEILMSDGISYAPVNEQNWRQWFYYLRSLNGLVLSDYEGWNSIADYMARLDCRTAQNTAALIPYANVRALTAGWGRAAPDDTQIRLMRAQVEQAMSDGAVGLSTGLDYIVECFASTDEIVEVASAMAPWQGVYVTHVRYKKGTLAGVQEAVEIGRRAGVPVHISHLKGATPQATDELFDYIDRVARNEVAFSYDAYPYMPGSTMLNFLLPYDVWEEGPLGVLSKLNDKHVRQQTTQLLQTLGVPFDAINLAWFSTPAGATWQGQTLAELIRQRGGSPGDVLCDLLIDENLAALAVFSGSDETLIEPWLAHDSFMLGSDGIFFADGQVHPRVYGSATRILGPLVRDRKLFSLETAVKKMTSLPAERFQLADRGTLREGAFADVVVFDPATIADRATYDHPHRLSVGVQQVLVNGQLVWTDGQAVPQATPGRALPGRTLQAV